MKKEITVREWINSFNEGKYDSKIRRVQCEAGWYDWFCSDEGLRNRLYKMGNIIKDITNDFILDNYYVWFKNNCPCVGPLYDDFRFEPLDEDKREELYFGVACDDKRNEYKYCIFTARNGYKHEFFAKNKTQLVKIINQLGEELKNIKEEKEMIKTKTAYEEYKKEWIKDHISEELQKETYNEYLELLKDEDTDEDYTFEDYLNEYGYDGILYVCFDEFVSNEYQQMLEDEEEEEIKTTKNKPYKVLVTETYKKEVVIYAQNEDEAFEKAEEFVNEGKIDASDCVGVYDYERECFNKGEADDNDLEQLLVYNEE